MSSRRLPLLAVLCLAPCPPAPAAELVSGIDLAGMNPAVRPQDDFNAYANGGWIERTEIPADRPSWGSFGIVRQQSEEWQRAIIEELGQRTDLAPGSDEQKLGDLFASLMDEAPVSVVGDAYVQARLARIDAITSAGELFAVFGALQPEDIDVPAGFYVFADSRDTTRYAAFLTQSGLALPNRNYYLDENPRLAEVRAAYPGYIARLFALAGRAAEADAAAARVVALETRIATLHWPPEENRDATKTDNLFSVAELSRVSARIDWTQWLQAAGLSAAERLYVRQPNYIADLAELCASVPLDDWKDYLRFQVLHAAAPWWSAESFAANHALFGARINGLEAPAPRWQRAVRAVNGAMGEAVGRVWVDRHFPPAAKQRMDALVQNLLRAFEISLRNLEWMSPATRAQAEAKRANLGAKVGHPARWRDYSTLEIRRDDPVGNLARAAAWEYARRARRLNGPVDRDEWNTTPQTVNAFYSSRLNEIVFPAGILQPPFFNLAADDAVNYGAIGVTIGHEIGHAFDDQGRKSDAQGNLRDWWTPEDAAAFAVRADRLVAQFNQFEALPDLRVNGRLTLGENIGDLTGLTISFLAYQLSLDGRPAPVIDGLTGAQRFFHGHAQLWRSKPRPDFVRRIVLTDPHAPSAFRVIGPLRNFTPFYEAFGVRAGDGMFLPPEERVTIW